ncbi:MAG: class I SAM-dependent methyltransferase [Myxococcales bacterium]|nr:class I SAM-dependent methyltransferase [Myxococcales bacterium]
MPGEAPSFERHQGKISFTYRDGGLYGEFMNAGRLEAWRHALASHPIDRSRIVDVGCSYGSWSANWRALGFKTLCGIDPNPEVIPRAREQFDEAHAGDATEVGARFGPVATAGANGVLVHILEDREVVRFLRGVREALAPDGHFLFSVIQPEYYFGAGRREWFGPVSCARKVERHLRFAEEAGLRVVDQIGTFIDPWASPDFEFIAGSELREDPRTFEAFQGLSNLIRGHETRPFSELLLVARPA